MSHIRIIATMNAISNHQTNRFIHPLTCGNDSTHTLLFPFCDDGVTVKLICRDCDYKQPVPAMFEAQRVTE